MAQDLSQKLANLDLQGKAMSTITLHADDVVNVVSDVAPPLHLSTTFRYSKDPEKLTPWADYNHDEPLPVDHIYSRESAPNSTRFETILSQALKAPCLSYTSGLAALHAALVFFNPRTISIGGGYHGSHGVIDILTRLTGLKKVDLNCVDSELDAGDVILLETPVNPYGTSFRIEDFAKKAHSRGAYLIVDSTFGPPGLQDPFKWGADVVMHSGTKYLGGHSDLLCGVLATQREDWIKKLLDDRLHLGSVMGNMEGWLGVRSLRTLEIRVQRQSQNATQLVAWLNSALTQKEGEDGCLASAEEARVIKKTVDEITHSSLQEVDMPWLKEQMYGGFGPVFSILLKEERFSRHLPSKLRFFQHATSLGGVESLIEWRALSDTTVDRRLMRISIGLENWEDLKEDIVAGLKAVLE
ncbi:hypothetical protein FQN57_004521 [Myotisia sp. PD_48]|nr:hypothetical protein FQN57_004521 [Myotisia sp. PD_48]